MLTLSHVCIYSFPFILDSSLSSKLWFVYCGFRKKKNLHCVQYIYSYIHILKRCNIYRKIYCSVIHDVLHNTYSCSWGLICCFLKINKFFFRANLCIMVHTCERTLFWRDLWKWIYESDYTMLINGLS